MSATLLCLVGLPRSGKTTWAIDMASRGEFYPVICRDSIRLALHGRRYDESREDEVQRIVRVSVTALFMSGHKIVCLDETNITETRRNSWLSRCWDVRIKLFDATMEECIKRARKSRSRIVIPVIEKMAAEWEPLTEEERTRIWKGGNSNE